MTALEKLRKLLTGKMPNGKTRAEACADSYAGCALTIGDCAELLQEIDRLRGEASGAREARARICDERAVMFSGDHFPIRTEEATNCAAAIRAWGQP